MLELLPHRGCKVSPWPNVNVLTPLMLYMGYLPVLKSVVLDAMLIVQV